MLEIEECHYPIVHLSTPNLLQHQCRANNTPPNRFLAIDRSKLKYITSIKSEV